MTPRNMPDVVIRVDDPARPEVRRLIELLDAYQTSLYPIDSKNLMPVEVLRQANVCFLTASVDGRIAGCGAFVNRDGQYAEIKRMFVLPKYRGLKLGRTLLEHLESRVAQAGLSLLLLETGIHQQEALMLYQSAGYLRRGPFGGYLEDEWTIFFEKRAG